MGFLRSRPRLTQRVTGLLLDTDVEGAELVAVLAAWATGLILSLPLGTLEASPLYLHLRGFAPPWAWALVADLLAAWQTLALLLHRRPCRRWGLQAAAGWWACLATFLFLASRNGLVWSYCLVFCVANSWAYWRLRREERLWDGLGAPPPAGRESPEGAGRRIDGERRLLRTLIGGLARIGSNRPKRRAPDPDSQSSPDRQPGPGSQDGGAPAGEGHTDD